MRSNNFWIGQRRGGQTTSRSDLLATAVAYVGDGEGRMYAVQIASIRENLPFLK
jgi:hypothetical protein